MSSFNKVIIIGNLTRDPEVKYTSGGTALANISLAVNHTWFDKQANAKREEVTYVEVTLWGRTAEIAGEYLAKGRPVLIEGRLKTDSWDDKETGKKRSKMIVVGENMTMLGSAKPVADQTPVNSRSYGEEPQVPGVSVPDEVPF